MPMMNVAQVRALSVEDITRFSRFPDEVPVNDYSRRLVARQIVDGGRTKWYDIEYDGPAQVMPLIEWLMEVNHKLSQVGQGVPSVQMDEDVFYVTVSVKEVATEEQKGIALQWLLENPQPVPDPANVIRWRPIVPFTIPQEGAILDDDAEQF